MSRQLINSKKRNDMDKQSPSVAKLYKKKQIESASPMQLVLLLYNGAIDHLNKSEQGMKKGTPEGKEEFRAGVTGTQNIITELAVSLDMEKGGEIAKQLFQLYDYMSYRLTNTNIAMEVDGIIEVRGLLLKLKTSWEIVAKEEPEHTKAPLLQEGLNLQG